MPSLARQGVPTLKQQVARSRRVVAHWLTGPANSGILRGLNRTWLFKRQDKKADGGGTERSHKEG